MSANQLPDHQVLFEWTYSIKTGNIVFWMKETKQRGRQEILALWILFMILQYEGKIFMEFDNVK